MVDHKDEECKEGTKLYHEFCEPDDEDEYEDDDS